MNPAFSTTMINRLVSQCINFSTRARLSSSLRFLLSTSRCVSTLHPATFGRDGKFNSVANVDKSFLSMRAFKKCSSLVPTRAMAGHSKWQNIKHTKTSKDSEKARITVQITTKIRAVVRETGNSDPKSNPSLARLIAEAKSKNLPNSTIDTAITQASKSQESASIQFFEARGPGGCCLVFEASTDKPTKTRNDLQAVMKRHGGVIEQGTSKRAFDKKGVLEATVNGEDLDMDKFVDMAIEAGAEEVTMETDENDEKYLRFLCEAQDLYSVKNKLEKTELDLRSFGVEFLPLVTVSLSPKELEVIGKLMNKIEDYPEILRVFINVDAPDS